jgi:hypothetical protein
MPKAAAAAAAAITLSVVRGGPVAAAQEIVAGEQWATTQPLLDGRASNHLEPLVALVAVVALVALAQPPPPLLVDQASQFGE